MNSRACLLALGAIALWATLASLGVALARVPPFLLTGLALLIGALPALPRWRDWRVPPATLALGIYGLFGFHLLLFVALRDAPPVEANLINYLWPLLIVLLAPLVLPGLALRPVHVAAALLGFAGAALAITGGRELSAAWSWGYLAAAGSALIWATYSLLTRRVAHFPTAAIGLFAAASGLLSLACHALLEPRVMPTPRELLLIGVMGLGPLGAAFYLWDAALKRGDARAIGVLSYLTPLASTVLLVVTTGREAAPHLWLAAAMVVGAALLAVRAAR
jgi:drug/metabolite transporter (DMT)-like permease